MGSIGATVVAEVRIRLAIGAVRLEYSGTRSFFERLVEPLVEAAYQKSAEGGIASSEAPAESAGPDPVDTVPAGPIFHPGSPAQFNQYAGQVGKNAATVEQRIMAFAFYLWNYERQEEFSAVDIEAFFGTVLEEPPEDLPGRIRDLIEGKRFLEPGAAEETWRLTSKGVNYVKNRLLGTIV
jgi:hypothetical protein